MNDLQLYVTTWINVININEETKCKGRHTTSVHLYEIQKSSETKL